MNTNLSPAAQIRNALLAAALFLAIAIAIRQIGPDAPGAELAHRLWGVLLGGMVVVYANAAPKSLQPLASMRCNPAAEQSVRRFAGWSLTLGGLAYATAWVVAPLAKANAFATALLFGAFLLTVARCLWAIAKRRIV